jgi:hypothetical protein
VKKREDFERSDKRVRKFFGIANKILSAFLDEIVSQHLNRFDEDSKFLSRQKK